ncbi:MAG: serine/threonine-protein kinase [Acidobacteriota bacterium]|nr:serine/threonine protein kinase [Blastocatellia bacterium]MDW8413302.1 serine/threonine-protein kinase [Acidobacteriota bacterium]
MSENANLLDDRYDVYELLGEGGVGVVYKARDLITNTDVAIKFLVQEAGEITRLKALRKRYFEREIALLEKIRHPGIVRLLNTGFTKIGLPYFVMEYIEGKTLAEQMRTERLPMPVGRVFKILQPLCSALDCIHKHGAIHRDLKPENIMLLEKDGKEEVKILDFGIAKLLEPPPGSPFQPITQVGNIVGTVDYLAPEQWKEEELDQRTDLYALGLIVYELLTGHHPFRSEHIEIAMMRHLSENAPPPSSYNNELPMLLDNVILRSIAKDKYDRQPTVIDFLTEYEEVLVEIYRRSCSYLSNPATKTLNYEEEEQESSE